MPITVLDSDGVEQTIGTNDDLAAVVATQATLSAAKTSIDSVATNTSPIGTRTDAKSTATDTTSVSAVSLWKQISFSAQATATSLAGTMTVSLPTGASTSALQTSGNTTLTSINTNQNAINTAVTALQTIFGARTDAKSTATDTTSVGIVQLLKQISASLQATSTDIFAEYEVIPASSNNVVIGNTGATGDYLAGYVVYPQVVGCGAVTIFDNATSLGVFPGGGTTPLPSCIPFFVPVGVYSVNGPFRATTGANVSILPVGNFT